MLYPGGRGGGGKGLSGLLEELPAAVTAAQVREASGSGVLTFARYFDSWHEAAKNFERKYFELYPPGREAEISWAQRQLAGQYLAASQFLAGTYMTPGQAAAAAELVNRGIQYLKTTPRSEWSSRVKDVINSAERAKGASFEGLGSAMGVLIVVAVIVGLLVVGIGLFLRYRSSDQKRRQEFFNKYGSWPDEGGLTQSVSLASLAVISLVGAGLWYAYGSRRQ